MNKTSGKAPNVMLLLRKTCSRLFLIATANTNKLLISHIILFHTHLILSGHIFHAWFYRLNNLFCITLVISYISLAGN